VQDFRNLKVWRKAHEATLAVYKTTRRFPREEIYGLTAQVRRACVSVGSNIAEGCGRRTKTEFLQFLYVALGSAKEVEYQLLLTLDLGYLLPEGYRGLAQTIDEVQRMLVGLIQRLRTPDS